MGPIYRLRVFWRHAVVVTDPLLVHQLLRGGTSGVSQHCVCACVWVCGGAAVWGGTCASEDVRTLTSPAQFTKPPVHA